MQINSTPVGAKGPDGWTYWPTQERDTVMCDLCMQHLRIDVKTWAYNNDLKKIADFAMREHNAHAPNSSENALQAKRPNQMLRCVPPVPTGFNRQGHGCMNHDGANAFYVSEDREAHV